MFARLGNAVPISTENLKEVVGRGYHAELKRLGIKTRNRIRALLPMATQEAAQRLNDIRASVSPAELAQVERVLWAHPGVKEPIVPVLFPKTPQTTEDFFRLTPIPLQGQIELLEIHANSEKEALTQFVFELAELNQNLIKRDLATAEEIILVLLRRYGYSHLLLRKAAFVKSLCTNKRSAADIDSYLVECGLERSNIIVTSLIHCYQEEQDFLSMKRSILNLQNRGDANRFTRDICRIPFYPFARNDDDLCGQLQSALQSSLIDAVLIAKVNSTRINSVCHVPTLVDLWDLLDKTTPSPNEIARPYDPTDTDSESLFYKHSSVWLEARGIPLFRKFLDNFFDAPESPYLKIDSELFGEVAPWVGECPLEELAKAKTLTCHGDICLQALEASGNVTRSALVNYVLYRTEGYASISEDSLITLMGLTRDLNKIIHVAYAANLAKGCPSKLSRLIIYFLVARKSRNEKDDHLLRRVFQEIATEQHHGSVIELLDHLYRRSKVIGVYAYEVLTEDFIAKLYQLVSTTARITEIRSEIHAWMGRVTGDKIYLDRARTLLIDSQINKVRNELDDNRIYVDVARFYEWFDDEMLGELTAALSSLEYKNYESTDVLDSVLAVHLERCYASFCSSKVFGIASYLGRRIRHGTFKGHLYAKVVAIEREERYGRFLAGASIGPLWGKWKQCYEARIDEIIRERLHVASQAKRNGFLIPAIGQVAKQDIVSACVRDLYQNYRGQRSTDLSKNIISEYCWRLAEVDLRTFAAFLKHQRKELADPETLHEIRTHARQIEANIAFEFVRDVSRAIEANLTALQNWFKRPINVSPKASLPLLYRAVAEEVRQTFPSIKIHTDVPAEQDIELIGGIYHVLYDALYVVVYNAAKHGKYGGAIIPQFGLQFNAELKRTRLDISIRSELSPDQSADSVGERLRAYSSNDIENAQVFEHRSGLPKLYQLQTIDSNFKVNEIKCVDREVVVTVSYLLEH